MMTEKNSYMTPEDLALKRKKHAVIADLRRDWQDGKLSDDQVLQLESLGVSKHSAKDVTPGYNDLATTNPALATQWHPTKNGDLTPQDVIAGSGRKVWWQCDEGHEWEAVINSRNGKGVGCPYCSRKRVLAGFNDLATLRPDLGAQWHPTKNGDLRPQDVPLGSPKKVWWLGECGHEWEAAVATRTGRGAGCPYCANRALLQGFNDLETVDPVLAGQFHPERNNGLTASQVIAHSTKRVWWRCERGHEWETRISHREKGAGCPFCSGQRAIPGENDLATVDPDLAAQWHPTRNGRLTPRDVKAGSHKKVWWQCDEGHEWQSTVLNRKNGNGCPYCAGQRLLPGVNDLATVNPALAAQWHPTRNGDLTPQDVMAGSDKKVWWQCGNGHEWEAAVYNRKNGDGCPYCSGHKVWPGYNDLATVNPGLAAQWHPAKNGDLTPRDVTAGSNKKVWWRCERGHEWEAKVAGRSRGRGCPVCRRDVRKK